jgi:hypothetical protein
VLQLGPKGVHFEKDNVFKSRKYAATAPTSDTTNTNSNSNGDSAIQAGSANGAAAPVGAGSTSSGTQNSGTQTSNTNTNTNASPDASAYSSTGSGEQFLRCKCIKGSLMWAVWWGSCACYNGPKKFSYAHSLRLFL